jgi:hypothetical protein
MKRTITIILQIIIVLIGIAALAFMLWEPHLEGRNINATNFEIYFKDPFLAYAYIASIGFFAALYQAFKALGYVKQGKAISSETLKALRIVKFCAKVLIVSVAAAVCYLFIVVRGQDDIAGGVAMGLLLIFVFGLMAVASTMLERKVLWQLS